MYLDFVCESVCIYMQIPRVQRCWMPKSWSYRQLWNIWCGCWEPSTYLLQEQQILLTIVHLSGPKVLEIIFNMATHWRRDLRVIQEWIWWFVCLFVLALSCLPFTNLLSWFTLFYSNLLCCLLSELQRMIIVDSIYWSYPPHFWRRESEKGYVTPRHRSRWPMCNSVSPFFLFYSVNKEEHSYSIWRQALSISVPKWSWAGEPSTDTNHGRRRIVFSSPSCLDMVWYCGWYNLPSRLPSLFPSLIAPYSNQSIIL